MKPKISTYAGRLPLVLLGIASLIAGAWGGLVRLPMNLPLPGGNANWLTYHGPLMVCGFLGTVIGLERAVGLRSWWTYVPPVLTGAGSALVIAGRMGLLPVSLITLGSLLFWGVTLKVVKMQPIAFTMLMSAGALTWVIGNAFWCAGVVHPDWSSDWPIYRIVPWWIAFLALTILGERLDLSRFQKPSKWSQPLLIALLLVLFAGLLAAIFHQIAGEKLLGTGLFATALWLGRFDIARRTVKNPGLPRFMALSLLIGYAWMALSGLLMFVFSPLTSGLKYDSVLHSFFLGFVFSMIFAHGPVIFPAVLIVQPVYSNRFYLHVVLLQAGLLLRITGDLANSLPVRQWGALLNAISLLVFLLNTVSALIFRPKPATSAKRAA